MVMPLISKPGREIEGKAANLVVAVVADGHVIVADRSVVLDHVREQARDLVAEQIARDNRGRKRRILERLAVQRPDGNGLGKIVVFHFAVDDDGGGDGRRLLLRGVGVLRVVAALESSAALCARFACRRRLRNAREDGKATKQQAKRTANAAQRARRKSDDDCASA